MILLRGNHEWLRWFDNRISSGVYPAEALASIAPHVPIEMLEAYRLLFDDPVASEPRVHVDLGNSELTPHIERASVAGCTPS